MNLPWQEQEERDTFLDWLDRVESRFLQHLAYRVTIGREKPKRYIRASTHELQLRRWICRREIHRGYIVDWLVEFAYPKNETKLYYLEPEERDDAGTDYGIPALSQQVDEGREVRRHFTNPTAGQIFRLGRGVEICEQTPSFKALPSGRKSYAVKLDSGEWLNAVLDDSIVSWRKYIGQTIVDQGYIYRYFTKEGTKYSAW